MINPPSRATPIAIPTTRSVHEICGSHFANSPIAESILALVAGFLAAHDDSPCCAVRCCCLVFIQMTGQETRALHRRAGQSKNCQLKQQLRESSCFAGRAASSACCKRTLFRRQRDWVG